MLKTIRIYTGSYYYINRLYKLRRPLSGVDNGGKELVTRFVRLIMSVAECNL